MELRKISAGKEIKYELSVVSGGAVDITIKAISGCGGTSTEKVLVLRDPYPEHNLYRITFYSAVAITLDDIMHRAKHETMEQWLTDLEDRFNRHTSKHHTHWWKRGK